MINFILIVVEQLCIRKDTVVRELVNLMKELLLIKEEKVAMVGLCSLKKTPAQIVRKSKKKVSKEVKLSDLMRRH